MEDDKIKINLQMAGVTYPLTIHREDEEIVRKAAKLVDVKLNTYRERYKSVALNQESILVMVAYQFALESLQQAERNDTAPYLNKITELTELLEEYIKKES